MKLNRKSSITLPSVLLMVVVLCPVAPASAQDGLSRCDTLLQTVIDLRSHDRATEPDILESRLNAAKDALSCIDGRGELPWLTWLPQQEIVALNGLQRYREAQDVVDEFFGAYATRADSADVARFYMWDLRFKHFDGKFSEALESYHQGLPYAHKLTDEYQKHYLLNAGSVHLAEGKFKEALTIYREVRQTFTRIPSPSDNTLFELYGRTLLGEAEAGLDLVLYNDQPGVDLERVIEQLSQAASIFTLTGSHARGAVANSALGLAHTLNRNPREGQLFLGLAFSLAERRLLHREEILILYCRALARFLEEEYDDALPDVDEALTLGQRYNIAEFETRLRYLKGQVYGETGDFEKATEAYEAAFKATNQSTYGRDKHLIQPGSESAFHVNKTIPSASPYLTYLFGSLGLLLALSLLAYLVGRAPRRRKTENRSRPAEPAPSHTSPSPALRAPAARTEAAETSPSPEESTPGAAPLSHRLRHGPARLRAEVEAAIHDNPLLRKRLVYVGRVVFEREAVAEAIDDPLLKGMLRAGRPPDNDMLFRCEGALEELDGEAFDNDPANTIGKYLRGEFKRRHIPWPRTPEAWRWLFER